MDNSKVKPALLFFLLLAGAVIAVPVLQQISPTDAYNDYTNNASFLVNTSINETALQSLVWSWDDVNYTIYNNTVLNYNMNNNTDLGENATLVVDNANANNGTLENGAYVNETGKYLKGITFDGENDYIKVMPDANLNITDVVTITGWIKPRGSTNNQRITAKGSGQLSARFRSGNEIDAIMTFTSAGLVDSNPLISTITPDVWTHFAVIFNGTHLLGYHDGVLEGSQDIGADTLTTNSNLFTISSYSGTAEYFNGTLDEIAVFNEAFTSDEVAQLYMTEVKRNNWDNWTFWVNQTDATDNELGEGTYNYYACAEDTSGNVACTSPDSVTVVSGFLQDGCGTISSSGTYYQTASFTGSSNNCILIDSSDVVYDAQGFNARTTGSELFQINYGNVTVQNGGLFRHDGGNYLFTIENCPSNGIIRVDNISRIFGNNDYAGGFIVDDGCHLEVSNIGNPSTWQGIEIYPDNDVRYGFSNYFSGYIDKIVNVTMNCAGSQCWAMREWGSTSPTHRGNWSIINFSFRMNKDNAASPRGIWVETYELNDSYILVQDASEGNSAGIFYGLQSGDNAKSNNMRIVVNDTDLGRAYMLWITGSGAVHDNLSIIYTKSGSWLQTSVRDAGSGNTIKNSDLRVWCANTGHSSSYPCYGVDFVGATSETYNKTQIIQSGNADYGAAMNVDSFSTNNMFYSTDITANGNTYALWLKDSFNNMWFDSVIDANSQVDIYRTNDAGDAGIDSFVNITLADTWSNIDVNDGEIEKQWWVKIGVNNTKYGLMVQNALVVASSLNTSYQGDIAYGKTGSDGYTTRHAMSEAYINETGSYSTYFDLEAAKPEVGTLENQNPTNNTNFIVNMSLSLQPMPESHCAGNTTDAWFSLILLDSEGNLLSGSITAYMYDEVGSQLDTGNMNLNGQYYMFNSTAVNGTGNYYFVASTPTGVHIPCVFSTGGSAGGSDINYSAIWNATYYGNSSLYTNIEDIIANLTTIINTNKDINTTLQSAYSELLSSINNTWYEWECNATHRNETQSKVCDYLADILGEVEENIVSGGTPALTLAEIQRNIDETKQELTANPLILLTKNPLFWIFVIIITGLIIVDSKKNRRFRKLMNSYRKQTLTEKQRARKLKQKLRSYDD